MASFRVIEPVLEEKIWQLKKNFFWILSSFIKKLLFSIVRLLKMMFPWCVFWSSRNWEEMMDEWTLVFLKVRSPERTLISKTRLPMVALFTSKSVISPFVNYLR